MIMLTAPMRAASVNDRADQVLDQLRARGVALSADIRGRDYLWQRCATQTLRRPGRVSANGSCQMLRTKDGFVALNLARADDHSLLPAWLQQPSVDADQLASACLSRDSRTLVERGRLMGMAVAPLGPERSKPQHWYQATLATDRAALSRPARVLDLSALWAGPLAGHLLERAGMRVTKVEAEHRPDGVRIGNPALFQALNGAKARVSLPLHTDDGMRRLHALIDEADIVIEGSRPRALKQLGVDCVEFAKRSNRLWLTVTAYGRPAPWGDWVGFGDDVAVAAGIFGGTPQAPYFVGDAVADPLAGMHAALACLHHWQAGHNGVLDVSLYAVAAHCRAHVVDPDHPWPT